MKVVVVDEKSKKLGAEKLERTLSQELFESLYRGKGPLERGRGVSKIRMVHGVRRRPVVLLASCISLIIMVSFVCGEN